LTQQEKFKSNRVKLTPRVARHRLRFDNQQVWEAGKAVRIGHGPATVIGETPKVRTPSQAAVAGTLREKGSGAMGLVFLARLFYSHGSKKWKDDA
jgi:hypothetical protein